MADLPVAVTAANADGVSVSANAVITVAAPAGGRTFFVRTGGNDAANGFSDGDAWASLSKVQSFADTSRFGPGDSVLFRGGDTFDGILSFGAGDIQAAEAAPFRLGKYGTGDPTIRAAGAGSVTNRAAAILVDSCSHVVLQDLFLRVRSDADGRFACGIWLNNSTANEIRNLTVERCDTSGFWAPSVAGAHTAGAHVYITTTAFGQGLRGVRVRNCNMHGAAAGSRDLAGIQGFSFGGNLHDLAYEDNHVWNMGGENAPNYHASGILLNGVVSGIAQRNLVHDIGGNNNTICGGPVGIWVHHSIAAAANPIIIQFNEVHRVQPLSPSGSICDHNAFGADAGAGPCSNILVQYNYGHDCFGAGLYNWGRPDSGGNVYRYNVMAKNNTGGQGWFGEFAYLGGGNTGITHVYGNAFWGKARADKQIGCIAYNTVGGMPAAGSVFANNIISMDAGQFGLTHMVAANQAAPTPMHRNNLWHARNGNMRWTSWGGGQPANTYSTYAAWAAASGETGGVNANPQFVGAGITPDDLRLLAASPARNAGLALSALGIDPGVRDFYGNPLAAPFNIGAEDG